MLAVPNIAAEDAPAILPAYGFARFQFPFRNALFMLAWGHDFKYADCSIWECAEALRTGEPQNEAKHGGDLFVLAKGCRKILRLPVAAAERSLQS